MTVKQLKTVIEELNRNRGARPGSQRWVKKSYKTRDIMLAKVIAEHQRPITIQHIQREVAQNLLATWCMKKISSDKRPVLAMGSINEAFIRDAIPSFLYEHADVIVIQLRECGLLENKGMPFIVGLLVYWGYCTIRRSASRTSRCLNVRRALAQKSRPRPMQLRSNTVAILSADLHHQV